MIAMPPTLRLEEVVVEPSYVLGFPTYVGITLAVDPVSATLSRVPLAGWEDTRDMVGVRLYTQAQLVIEAKAGNVADPEVGVPVTRLRAGEHRRILVDLSEVLPPTLAPDRYQALITFGPPEQRAQSDWLTLNMRAPNSRETELLRVTSAEREERGSWGQWTRFPPTGASPTQLPWGPSDPLRFNWLMRDMLYGPGALQSIPLTSLDVLDGLFLPERAALQAEILAQRGDAGAFQAHLADAKRAFPELSWWLDHIEPGGSVIAWTRRHREI